jgi:3'(2'), 5'-bisphosphate nucleotidase
MSSGDFHGELELARRLAIEAGAILLEVYATDFAVEHKPGGAGPVTEADARANEHIVSALQREFPTDAIVAEESSNSNIPKHKRCWFVDPLDGTREFVDRNGMFAVHIGLAVDGSPRVGVVYAPVAAKLYVAISGGECLLEHGGNTRHLRVADPPARSEDLRLLTSRSHKSKKTALIRERLGIHHVIEHGSVGLKCGLLAEGAADVYLHPSARSYRWDSCAPEAILRAAGGVLTDFGGVPYRYDGPELENARGILACSAGTFPMVLPTLLGLKPSSGRRH